MSNIWSLIHQAHQVGQYYAGQQQRELQFLEQQRRGQQPYGSPSVIMSQSYNGQMTVVQIPQQQPYWVPHHPPPLLPPPPQVMIQPVYIPAFHPQPPPLPPPPPLQIYNAMPTYPVHPMHHPQFGQQTFYQKTKHPFADAARPVVTSDESTSTRPTSAIVTTNQSTYTNHVRRTASISSTLSTRPTTSHARAAATPGSPTMTDREIAAAVNEINAAVAAVDAVAVARPGVTRTSARQTSASSTTTAPSTPSTRRNLLSLDELDEAVATFAVMRSPSRPTVQASGATTMSTSPSARATARAANSQTTQPISSSITSSEPSSSSSSSSSDFGVRARPNRATAPCTSTTITTTPVTRPYNARPLSMVSITSIADPPPAYQELGFWSQPEQQDHEDPRRQQQEAELREWERTRRR